MDEMNGSEKTQNDNKTVIDELMKGDLGVIEQFLIIDDSRKVVGKCLKIVCIGEQPDTNQQGAITPISEAKNVRALKQLEKNIMQSQSIGRQQKTCMNTREARPMQKQAQKAHPAA